MKKECTENGWIQVGSATQENASNVNGYREAVKDSEIHQKLLQFQIEFTMENNGK